VAAHAAVRVGGPGGHRSAVRVAGEARAIGTTTRLKHSKASSNDWFAIFPQRAVPELFAEVHRVLRRNTHFIYLFCDPETMFVAKPEGVEGGVQGSGSR